MASGPLNLTLHKRPDRIYHLSLRIIRKKSSFCRIRCFILKELYKLCKFIKGLTHSLVRFL